MAGLLIKAAGVAGIGVFGGALLSYRTGYWIPTDRERLLRAQGALLGAFVRAPMYSRETSIGDGRVINWVDSASPEEVKSGKRFANTLVLAHGYGSGLAMFFNNFGKLLEVPAKGGSGYDRVIAFDWLGFGASTRAPFASGAADRFFLDSLVPVPSTRARTHTNRCALCSYLLLRRIHLCQRTV